MRRLKCWDIQTHNPHNKKTCIQESLEEMHSNVFNKCLQIFKNTTACCLSVESLNVYFLFPNQFFSWNNFPETQVTISRLVAQYYVVKYLKLLHISLCKYFSKILG